MGAATYFSHQPSLFAKNNTTAFYYRPRSESSLRSSLREFALHPFSTRVSSINVEMEDTHEPGNKMGTLRIEVRPRFFVLDR